MVVFKFEDKRPARVLGRDNDGAAITAVNDVADWVGWALFDELEKAGCQPQVPDLHRDPRRRAHGHR